MHLIVWIRNDKKLYIFSGYQSVETNVSAVSVCIYVCTYTRHAITLIEMSDYFLCIFLEVKLFIISGGGDDILNIKETTRR